jgi:cytochrome c biogenesis protein CcmG, thiol:disulfide interchange protein DsbE
MAGGKLPETVARQETKPESGQSPVFTGTFQADDGSRTRDLRLGKPTLYQLSYVRVQAILRCLPPGGDDRRPARGITLKSPMRRLVVPGLIVAAAAALLALLAFGVSHQGSSSTIDASVNHGDFPMAPNSNLALPVLGQTGAKSLADLRGKVVVLNVFASWCDPCKSEAPILEHEQRRLAGRNATILGVTYLDNSSDSETFVRKEHITYPVLRDVSGNFVRSFGTTGVPETFVINREGRIEALRRFQVDSDWLRRTLPTILAQRS